MKSVYETGKIAKKTRRMRNICLLCYVSKRTITEACNVYVTICEYCVSYIMCVTLHATIVGIPLLLLLLLYANIINSTLLTLFPSCSSKPVSYFNTATSNYNLCSLLLVDRYTGRKRVGRRKKKNTCRAVPLSIFGPVVPTL